MTSGENLGELSEIVGTRVRLVREQRRWSVEQLAAACAQAGASQLTVNALYALESGRKEKGTGRRRRHVTVDELLAIAYALGVHPVDLVVPGDLADDEPFDVAPAVRSTAGTVRAWLGGLGFIDEPASLAELAAAIQPMPKERRQAISRAWFTPARMREINAAALAHDGPDERSLLDLITAAASVSADPAAVVRDMAGALRDVAGDEGVRQLAEDVEKKKGEETDD